MDLYNAAHFKNAPGKGSRMVRRLLTGYFACRPYREIKLGSQVRVDMPDGSFVLPTLIFTNVLAKRSTLVE